MDAVKAADVSLTAALTLWQKNPFALITFLAQKRLPTITCMTSSVA